MPEDAIYVGRPTKWGNPFWHAQRFYGIDDALALYRDAAMGIWNPTRAAHHANPQIAADDAMAFSNRLVEHPIEVARRELRGHDLACWCPLDRPCHADVLLAIANAD